MSGPLSPALPLVRRPARPRFGPRHAWLIAAGAVLATTASACSGESDGATPSTTAAARITTTTVTTTTAAVTTTTLAPVGRPDAKEAALALYGSWQANDRVGASLVAEPAAVDAIFAAPTGNYQLYRGCDTGEFETGGCLFRDRSNNNTIQIDVVRRNGNWVVATAFFSPG